MKTINIVVLAIALVLFSCNKDGAKPVIEFHELGMENSKTATIVEDLHMDAAIDAENKIDVISVKIHPEGDEHKSASTLFSDEHGWEFDTLYTEFSGLRNTDFHEHIEIPEDAEAGHYHFHFTVTDLEGYQTSYEEEVELLAPESAR